jgi:hypothetical protein
MANRRGSSSVPLPLLGGFATFLVVIFYIVASSLARPVVRTFEPSARRALAPASDSVVTDTVTVDATDAELWRFLDLDHRALLEIPDTAGWDLAFRRHSLISSGGAFDLGAVVYDDVVRAPSGPFTATVAGRDTANAVLQRWYRYRLLTHLLEPNTHIYAVRTSDGRYAKLEILSYYCPGVRAGCPTVRYTIPLASP